jgi:thiol-disulfide isomerase/thioredoxin
MTSRIGQCSPWLFRLALLFPAILAFATANAAEDEVDPPEPISLRLAIDPSILDMEHLKASRMGYMPTSYPLVKEKPADIVKEPAYEGTVGYGAFRIGNGPNAVTLFAVDETGTAEADQKGRLYVDLNRNGDLTDDGPGEWEKTKVLDGVTIYFAVVPVRISWGGPLEETSTGEYRLFMYKRHGVPGFAYAKISGRVGQLELGDRQCPVVLAENSNDGIFTVPAKGDLTRKPVELYVDLDGDGTFKGVMSSADGKEFKSPERFSLSEPFLIEGQWYIGRPTISGDKLTLTPCDPPGSDVAKAQQPVEVKPLLSAGTPAPDFTVSAPDGKPISLADFRGKILIIDFWATWCGPCQSAMPGLEKVHQAVRDQGVDVLSLNVFDDKESFDRWIADNAETKYHFTFGFDPAAKGDENSIAKGKYHVPGLPTMYVVGRDGKVAGVLVGAGQEKPLVALLATQGIDVSALEEEASE